MSRFRVKKIVKTLPYLLADVEPDIVDDIPEDADEAKRLEMSVYNTLKYYVRLMKTYPKTQGMSITANARETRPLVEYPAADAGRRSAFSFSLANMIQLGQPVDGQLLLQTTDIMKRLESEKQILKAAVDNVCDQLLKVGVLTEASRTLIEDQSFNSGSDDSDILPVDIPEETEEEEKDEWNLQNAL